MRLAGPVEDSVAAAEAEVQPVAAAAVAVRAAVVMAGLGGAKGVASQVEGETGVPSVVKVTVAAGEMEEEV